MMHLLGEVMDFNITSVEILNFHYSCILILQLPTVLDNSISYSGLLGLDWNYPKLEESGVYVH